MFFTRQVTQGILGVPAAPAGNTDPYWNNVQLLVKANGSDGGTTFTDSSLNGYSSPSVTGVTTSTTQAKFGTASMRFSVGNSANAYLTWPDTSTAVANFNLANDTDNAFTIEAWIYVTSTSTAGHIFEWGTGSSSRNVVFLNGAYPDVYTDTGANGGTRVNNIAFVRNGSTDYRLYLDGNQCGSTYSGTIMYKANSKFDVGMNVYGVTAGDRFQGYMDELRVTKGVARYTTTFTPPTAEFPTS
jgi:Concanavalin A-like lectin/glucanases superfamily